MQEDTPQSAQAIGSEADLKPKNAVMAPNMQLDNKYCKGDKVWAVFSLGPDIKVNEFVIKSFNAEIMKDKPLIYIYGLSIDGNGHDNGINLSFLLEEMLFFDKNKAEKKAFQMVGEIVSSYNEKIDAMTKDYDRSMEINKAKYEGILKTMQEERSKCNAKHLDVAPIEVVVPPQDKVASDIVDNTPVEEDQTTTAIEPTEGNEANDIATPQQDEPDNADPETPSMTPDNEQDNQLNNDGQKTDTDNIEQEA